MLVWVPARLGNCLRFWTRFRHFVIKVAMIKTSQGNAEKVKNPYKIGVRCISVSKLGYKTPFYIRPVQNPQNWRRTDQNMDLMPVSAVCATSAGECCARVRFPASALGFVINFIDTAKPRIVHAPFPDSCLHHSS